MDDDKSTAPVAPEAEVVDSPVVESESEATVEQPVTEPSEEATDTTPSAPEADDKLRKYAANQGIELDSPSAIKAARLAMENQAEKTRNYQKASELEKTVTAQSDVEAEQVAEATGQDPELLKRLQRVEVKEAVRDFWNQDGVDRSFEPKMIEILATKPHLAGDLESLYATAVMKSGGVAAVKSQGKKEALSNLAHNQQAAVPKGSATTNAAPKGKEFKDLSIAEMEKQLGFAKR
jgi:hypothetical protein